LEWISGKRIKTENLIKLNKLNKTDILINLNSLKNEQIIKGLNNLYGSSFNQKEIINALKNLVKHNDEFISLSAAYTLGKQGILGVKTLISLMCFNDGNNVDDARCFIDEGQKSELEMICRNSAHGLVGSSVNFVDQLVAVYDSGQERIKKYICFIFGEISLNSQTILNQLVKGCLEKDPAIRLNAVEALGLKKCKKNEIQIIEKLLQDNDDEVRFNAALALARNGKRSKFATKTLIRCLNDSNRYVYSYALEALDRIDSVESNECLKKYLKITRYCPYTNFNSLF
jgi:hypothetical protein